MKNVLVAVFIISTLAACSAVEYGEKHPVNAHVVIASKPYGMNYYLLRQEQNRVLGGQLSPIGKQTVADKLPSDTRIRKTQSAWQLFQIGEYIALLDCGAVFKRQKVYLTDRQQIILSCEH